MDKDIPGREKGPMSIKDREIGDFDEESLQAIREGRLLPMPEALMRSPEAYQAVIDYIRHGDKNMKMEMIGAVERYIKELEERQGSNAQIASSIQQNLKEYGFRAAVAGGAMTTMVRGGMDVYAVMVFLFLYATLVSILPRSVQEKVQQNHAVGEELKRRLLEAMRPEEV